MHHAIVAHGRVQDVAHVLRVADEVGQKHGVTLLALDPDAVYNARHVESAILHATRAFQENRNTAKSLASEILLYLSGERQVQKAIERAGIKPGLDRVVVLGIGYRRGAAVWELLEKLEWSKAPEGLEENPTALARHGLEGLNGRGELALLERVALVDLRK